MARTKFLLLLCVVVLVLLPSPAAAFGAGNIASISKIEGQNWRHGDIEDILKTVAFLHGKKWTSMMIKRVYFGNWLRDYSQAVDVGALKGVQKDTIRILVWVLAFMSFGYATGEFEVTEERLGVYRPEEHIDNPKDYADNQDARQYDPRLRGPVAPVELAIDPATGLKNYIANESGGWATSLGYVKYSLHRSIHYGRLYLHGGQKGREEDLCEALRCLGQGLHCLEDFGAHTNYVELALREMGFHNVFPHVGAATQINVRGKQIFPLVTGTFGGVDFLHSVIGEAGDHVAQSEVDEMNTALGDAAQGKKTDGSDPVAGLTSLLSKIPGTGGLCQEAANLAAASNQQAAANSGMASGSRGFDGSYDDSYNASRAWNPTSFAAPPGSQGGPPGPGIPGLTNMNTDPQAIVDKIYPILQFRDKVVRAISSMVSAVGLDDLVEKITERVTLFVMSLLAPYIQPLIAAASQSLKQGSSAVIGSSENHQLEVWTDPNCSDPTHSILSKDHFANVLNGPAGQVAASILQYVVPRVLWAWDNPHAELQQVLDDVGRVFHHPALRDERCELHRNMFVVVERWARGRPDHGAGLNDVLSSEAVKARAAGPGHGHGHGGSQATAGGPMAMFNAPQRDTTQQQPGHQYYQDTYSQPPPPQQQQQWNQGYQQSHQQWDQSYQQSQQPQEPAGFVPNDPYAYPTAYQQGYEIPYDQQQGQQPPPGGSAPYGHQQQQGYGGYNQHTGSGYGGYGGNGY